MTPLEVLSVEPFGRDELLSRLRGVRLPDGTEIYAGAQLELLPAVDTGTLAPAQRYVLRGGVATIVALREALLPHGVDTFALDGGAYVRLAGAPDERVPVIPPVVEESVERDGRTLPVVNDGIHRVYAARSLGLPISVVMVRGGPEEYPYYAWALPGGWAEVTELDELPDGFQKKDYRREDGYKSLFRQFNEVFPGVQKQRKRTNPAHLTA